SCTASQTLRVPAEAISAFYARLRRAMGVAGARAGTQGQWTVEFASLGPGSRVSLRSPGTRKACDAVRLEHDPEKACLRLDPGWEPVLEKRSCSKKKLDHDPDSI